MSPVLALGWCEASNLDTTPTQSSYPPGGVFALSHTPPFLRMYMVAKPHTIRSGSRSGIILQELGRSTLQTSFLPISVLWCLNMGPQRASGHVMSTTNLGSLSPNRLPGVVSRRLEPLFSSPSLLLDSAVVTCCNCLLSKTFEESSLYPGPFPLPLLPPPLVLQRIRVW